MCPLFCPFTSRVGLWVSRGRGNDIKACGSRVVMSRHIVTNAFHGKRQVPHELPNSNDPRPCDNEPNRHRRCCYGGATAVCGQDKRAEEDTGSKDMQTREHQG